MAKKSQAVPPGQYAPNQRFANPNTNKPATTNVPPQKTPTHKPGGGAKKMAHGHM